jgi:hypothetical protein
MHPVHNFPPYFLKIHSNFTFPFTPPSSEWLFPLCFPNRILYIFIFPSACYTPHNLVFLDFISLIVAGETHKLRSSSLCSLLYSSTLYSPQHLQPMFFLQCERPSFTPIQNNR